MEIKQKLKKELRHFTQNNKKIFEKLATSQNPKILFITCSDSRVCPGQMTNTKPGDLFIIRNAGNVIMGKPDLATIEYAVVKLNVKWIIVCGHKECGAMHAVKHPESANESVYLKSYVSEITKEFKKNDLKKSANELSVMNARNQIKILKSMNFIKNKLNKKQIKLYGVIYDFKKGTLSFL